MTGDPRKTAGAVQELLPFLVNGTLGSAEKRNLQDALARDGQLRDQAEVLARLRDQMQAVPSPSSPAEFGLARLMRDIDRQARLRRAARWAALGGAAAAAIAVAVVSLPRTSAPGFVQASDTHSAAGDLAVAFAPSATLAQMTELLLSHDLVVVQGPSALGLYQLDVPRDTDVVAVSVALRRSQGIVESVSVSE